MLTDAMKRYLENPPSNWEELSNKEKQYFRNIEARMRAHISEAVQDLNLLKKLTPAQLERVYSYEQTDTLIQIVEASLTALRAPMETVNKHMDFMIDFTTRNKDCSNALKNAFQDPEYILKLEEDLHECQIMRNAAEYELKKISPEEYISRLEGILKRQK